MASEIRVNTINNRSGLGTISINDSGASFSGVVTATGGFSGDLTGNATGLSGSPTLSIGAGSTSAPSLSPSGDSNTGIFFPSADTIAFAEGGVEALRIDSNGDLQLTAATNGSNQSIQFGDPDASNRGLLQYRHGDDSLRVYVAASEKLHITSGGNVQIANGNLVFSTSGTGIDFSATSDAAGMTSELLDDYEEGTWTPTISFNGSATGVVYSVQDGYYVKIGSIVTLSFRIGISNKGSSTGNLRIEGQPFRPGTPAKRVSGVLGEAMGGAVGTPCFVRTESSSSFMLVIKPSTGGMATVNNSDFTTFDNYGVITFQI